jgi:hypothetical protein
MLASEKHFNFGECKKYMAIMVALMHFSRAMMCAHALNSERLALP